MARIPAPMCRGSLLGLAVLGAGNLTMVGIMAVAPVHLAAHGHDLSFVGLVISVHVAGMLGPSPVTGWRCDRIGPGWLAAGGGALLAAGGLWGAVAVIVALLTPRGESATAPGGRPPVNA